MTDDIKTDEKDLLCRTWNKLERNLRKEGFREGALKGKEEYYQIGFDRGYEEGFKLGEAFGCHRGSLSAMKESNVEKLNVRPLEDTRLLQDKACVLCGDKNFSLNLDNILGLQKKRNNEVMKDLNGFTDNG